MINPVMKVLIFAGAHVVQSLAMKLGLLLGDGPNYGIGKECDCVVLMLAHLYNYRVCSYFDKINFICRLYFVMCLHRLFTASSSMMSFVNWWSHSLREMWSYCCSCSKVSQLGTFF